jgi:hypothetical protein
MTPEKQQTPLQKVSDYIIDAQKIAESDPTLRLSAALMVINNKIKSLLPEEKQMVIDAYYDGDEDCMDQNKRTGKEYFQEKYES